MPANKTHARAWLPFAGMDSAPHSYSQMASHSG